MSAVDQDKLGQAPRPFRYQTFSEPRSLGLASLLGLSSALGLGLGSRSVQDSVAAVCDEAALDALGLGDLGLGLGELGRVRGLGVLRGLLSELL